MENRVAFISYKPISYDKKLFIPFPVMFTSESRVFFKNEGKISCCCKICSHLRIRQYNFQILFNITTKIYTYVETTILEIDLAKLSSVKKHPSPASRIILQQCPARLEQYRCMKFLTNTQNMMVVCFIPINIIEI